MNESRNRKSSEMLRGKRKEGDGMRDRRIFT